MTDTTPLLITPETKVGAMLDRYPELIDTLVSLSDRYRNLTNPILRKSVAPRTPVSYTHLDVYKRQPEYHLSNTFPTVYFFQEEDNLHVGVKKFLRSFI